MSLLQAGKTGKGEQSEPSNSPKRTCKGKYTSMQAVSTLIPLLAMMNLVHAQDQTDTEELDALTVWGTDVQASSVKLGEQSIGLKQPDHVSDLLRPLPGVDVGGAHSLNQRITIRSMDDKDLRISIDGATQNTYMYHHMGNLQIHADILESVEVGVGNNSVLDGGLGGNVRFRTKSAEQLLNSGQRAGGRVQFGYGNNSNSSLALTGYGLLTDSVNVLAYYNTVQRENYDVGGGQIKDFNGELVEGTDGTVRGLEGDLADALIKFGWDLNDYHRLSFGFENYNDEGDYSYRPDMGLATDLAITNSLGVPLLWPTEFSRNTLTFSYEGELSGGTDISATLFSNTSELKRDESGWAENEAFADSAGQIAAEAQNTGMKVLVQQEAGRHSLSYGVDLINYDTDHKSVYPESTNQASEKVSETAVFVQDKINLHDRFSLTPGLRFNNQDNDTTVVDGSFKAVTGALAGDLDISSKVHMRLSATQLFKGPEIGEVFVGAGSGDTPNEGIKEESGINTELTIAYEDAILGADAFGSGFTVFNTRIDDYIYDYATPPEGSEARYWKDNVGNMSIDGVEAYLSYDRGAFKSLLSYSLADSDLDAHAEYAAFDGSRLDRTQGDTIAFSLDYQLLASQITLHWDTQRVGAVDTGDDLDGATENNKKDGFTVHNISARWTPSQVKGLSLTLGIDNLLDEYYASQSSRTGLSLHPRFGELYLQDYEPGRNIKLTAAYTF